MRKRRRKGRRRNKATRDLHELRHTRTGETIIDTETIIIVF